MKLQMNQIPSKDVSAGNTREFKTNWTDDNLHDTHTIKDLLHFIAYAQPRGKSVWPLVSDKFYLRQ